MKIDDFSAGGGGRVGACFPPDVSVAVITHNAKGHIAPTLESLEMAGCPRSQITAIDVASTDGCPDFIEEKWPGVHVVRLAANLGPDPARNIGIRNASTPFVFIMDSDVSVESDTILVLRSVMETDSSIAIASPVVVYADKPNTIQYAGTGIHFICEAVNDWQGKTVEERGTDPMVIGCASANGLLILRDAAMKVGLFDERYFLGKEDGDFTHRIKIAGFKIMEVPEARVHHRHSPRGKTIFYYQIRNRWHFMLKNYELRTLIFLFPILLLHEGLQAMLLVFKGGGMAYVNAISGLSKMALSLKGDRAFVAGFRVCRDKDLLLGGPIVVRDDFIKNPFLKKGKKLYDNILTSYWNLLRKTVLR